MPTDKSPLIPEFMRSIYIREIHSFFSSIVGYLTLLIFLVATGLFIWVIPDSSILNYGFASVAPFFQLAPWFLLLLIPAITMRSFPEEFRSGTMEWLSTKPLSVMDIIWGKFLASFTLSVLALIPTGVYVLSLYSLSLIEGDLDYGAIIGSYLGLIALIGGFTAIGTFCSSLTQNQIVGFLLSLFGCYLLYGGVAALASIPSFAGAVEYYLGMFGMSYHYQSMSRGYIDSRDIIYFISLIILFVSLTRYSLESRLRDKSTR